MSTTTSPSGRISTPASHARRRTPAGPSAGRRPGGRARCRPSARAGGPRARPRAPDDIGGQAGAELRGRVAATLASTSHSSNSCRWRRATAAAGRSRCRSGRGTASARERSAPRNASKTRPDGHRGRHRQVAAGDALADAEQVGPQAALLARRTACRCGRSRWRPRRTISSTSCRRHASATAAHERRARAARMPGRALHERLDHDRGELVGVWRSMRGDAPRAGVVEPGSAAPGSAAGRTRSVPNPPSPTASEPMVSPW